MAAKPEFTKAGFLKAYLLPALITFLIPGFGLWFFNHVEGHYDSEIREELLSQIRSDRDMSEEQRQKALKFYEKISVSRVLASNNPKAKPLQESFQSVHIRYSIFRWMKRTATICLAAGVGAFVVVGVGVLFSFRSQNALFWSLRVSWTVLRCFAVIEVVGQGALAIALSFWMTAFWMERYFVKL